MPEGRVEIEMIVEVWGLMRERYGIAWPMVSKRKSMEPAESTFSGSDLV